MNCDPSTRRLVGASRNVCRPFLLARRSSLGLGCVAKPRSTPGYTLTRARVVPLAIFWLLLRVFAQLNANTRSASLRRRPYARSASVDGPWLYDDTRCSR